MLEELRRAENDLLHPGQRAALGQVGLERLQARAVGRSAQRVLVDLANRQGPMLGAALDALHDVGWGGAVVEQRHPKAEAGRVGGTTEQVLVELGCIVLVRSGRN